MINILERQFDLSAPTCAAGTADRWDAQAGRLAKKIKQRSGALIKGLSAYFGRLLFPLGHLARSRSGFLVVVLTKIKKLC